MVGKQLLGAQGKLVFDGNDLEEHIHDPNDPQQMQGREGLKELESVQHCKRLGMKQIKEGADDENQTAPDQPGYVDLSCPGHWDLLSVS